MKTLIRLTLALLLIAALWVALDARLAAQPGAEEEVLEDFQPSERLPADSAISFPVDI